MLPLKKTWLYPAIAGIALLASACANNAAPNYAHPNQTAPHVTNVDGLHGRNYDGMRSANFDGMHVRNGVGLNNMPSVDNGKYPNGTYPRANVNQYNAYTSGMRPYNAFTGPNDGVLGTPNRMGHSIYQKRAWDRAGAGIMQTGMPKMGYAQTSRASMNTAGAQNVYVDRDALAQAVGNVTTSCPGVQRSTVLVTDEEIFVGLHTQGVDARTAKNQAKMNAQSISPRYYKVYVTDNPNDIQEIARVASRSSNLHTARNEDAASIDTLIKRLGGVTDGEQGKSMNAQKSAKATHPAKMGTTSR
ncbi:YhcN/YlaJ family sporulation lipoprotein [Brevibacillus sp. SAFN-007a]|uniref:YhcN/YlaJ family sporulation lipoprotein n=1 Tax=Brevibacillus sp. SAFN-007a TaxID=3436862 RepID=UPI003F800B59